MSYAWEKASVSLVSVTVDKNFIETCRKYLELLLRHFWAWLCLNNTAKLFLGGILNGKKAQKSMTPDTVMYMIMLQDFVIECGTLAIVFLCLYVQ